MLPQVHSTASELKLLILHDQICISRWVGLRHTGHIRPTKSSIRLVLGIPSKYVCNSGQDPLMTSLMMLKLALSSLSH